MTAKYCDKGRTPRIRISRFRRPHWCSQYWHAQSGHSSAQFLGKIVKPLGVSTKEEKSNARRAFVTSSRRVIPITSRTESLGNVNWFPQRLHGGLEIGERPAGFRGDLPRLSPDVLHARFPPCRLLAEALECPSITDFRKNING